MLVTTCRRQEVPSVAFGHAGVGLGALAKGTVGLGSRGAGEGEVKEG